MGSTPINVIFRHDFSSRYRYRVSFLSIEGESLMFREPHGSEMADAMIEASMRLASSLPSPPHAERRTRSWSPGGPSREYLLWNRQGLPSSDSVG